MNLKMEINDHEIEIIDDTLPVPMSRRLKGNINKLKKVCGKEVNKKAREFFEKLVAENKDKLKSAG